MCAQPWHWLLALLSVLLSCSANVAEEASAAGCPESELVEATEESEVAVLRVQLLQLGVSAARQPVDERYSERTARAFASLSQASQCSAGSSVTNWTCDACEAAGFSLVPGTVRLVRQAEFGEQDSTFVLAGRVRSIPGTQLDHGWSQQRPREPLTNAGKDCHAHCGGVGGYCAWCGVGNACCRESDADDPVECKNAIGLNNSERHQCVEVKDDTATAPAPLQNAGDDCWLFCGLAGGYCDWCGAGNACCRRGSEHDPLECRGTNGTSDHHECVVPRSNVPAPRPDDFGCVMAVRGSRTFTNALHDAFVWSDSLPYEDCPGCQVVDGFWKVWNGVRGKASRVLLDSGCVPGGPRGRVLLTGHSLGAAVATIAMYTLQAQGYSVGLSYNFESPRVGNDAFQSSFDKLFNRSVALYRITRLRDPVPHLPPMALYRHVGSEVYFQHAGNASDNVVCYKAEDSGCANRYTMIETMMNGAGDHCQSELLSGQSNDICQCAIP
eukprot:TRINITY_DN27387_c0_g3_i1.p1 TRINITY_DN27387_c0_g3~~TRINITY_DN27387_c0_g3_i1.p1  ORF type:complete len:513 (+),score=65.62 TRINITY_DN27387_c0_g3_i1:49-1539(+)